MLIGFVPTVISICWLENWGAGKNVDVSSIPNITAHITVHWWVKQMAELNGMGLTQRLPAFQNITHDHSLNRLDDTFSAKHKPENRIVILLFALFLEKEKKSEGKLTTFLKRQRTFCIPDLSLVEGMLISCWAMALIILAKAKMCTSWLTLISTGCWSTPKRLCALLPWAPSQATWCFSEPYIALWELQRGAQSRMTYRAAVQGKLRYVFYFGCEADQVAISKGGTW